MFAHAQWKRLDSEFPSLAASLEKLKVKDAVLDMEAVVVNGEGKSVSRPRRQPLALIQTPSSPMSSISFISMAGI